MQFVCLLNSCYGNNPDNGALQLHEHVIHHYPVLFVMLGCLFAVYLCQLSSLFTSASGSGQVVQVASGCLLDFRQSNLASPRPDGGPMRCNGGGNAHGELDISFSLLQDILFLDIVEECKVAICKVAIHVYI